MTPAALPAGFTAVVTGSSRGLGRAFVDVLAAAGAAVVVNGTDPVTTGEAVDELTGRGVAAIGLAGSVADDAFCRSLIADCVRTFGRIDMLINNAGITADRSLTKMTTDEFDDVVAVHLRGTWSCNAAAARAMRAAGSPGRILNITSGAGLFGMFGQANYAAAKAGVVGLTRVMDLELHRHGIAVNALAPVAATAMTAVFDQTAGITHDLEFPPAESVATIVRHLATASPDVHGQCLSFDGSRLSVWSHPEPTASRRHDRLWNDDDFAAALTPDVLEFPHPDRWGTGARTS